MTGDVRTPLRSRSGGVRRQLAAEQGITLTEMLVVLVILGIILGAMTTLFVSASNSEAEQSNRYEAQRNARLALDGLRREIRCASAAPAVSGSSLTITLPGGCQKPPGTTAAPFTWCTVGGSAPYALWRYEGASCSGTGRRVAESLASTSVFTYSRAAVLAAPTLTASATGGTLAPGTYSYVVTARDAAGKETSGTVRRVDVDAGATNTITVSWSTSPGAVSYNVYGRDDGTFTAEGLRLLANTTATSYTDTGSTPLGTQSPPLAVVGVTLVVDATPASPKQRFTLSDDIVLRNSGRV